MATISELIREEADGTLSFGDYTLASKTKKEDFAAGGASYKVKTFKEITKLERDGYFVYESTPGTAVGNFNGSKEGAVFTVDGAEDAQITLEFEPETEYSVIIDGKDTGNIKTNLGGKLSLSVELDEGKSVKVEIKKA
ncbi:MAG: endosialidase [Lachnospiraceae bacterium]|nr:endosialidase [Lachnospiraceae bacterium]